MKTILFIYSFIIKSSLSDESAKSCFGGIATYEKTHGVFFNVTPSEELTSSGKQVVTPDCASLCSQSDNCISFSIDYERGACLAYDRDSIGRRDSLITQSGINYLEQVCYRGVSHYDSICGNRLWAFERVIGAYLDGFDDKEERNVVSKVDCEKLCLLEPFCRSAEYDELRQLCRLSKEDRRTKPAAFKYSPGSSIDYLENQCFKPSSDCKFEIVTAVSVTSLDDLQFTNTASDCQNKCLQTPLFTCWTFAFDNTQLKCYLSGESGLFTAHSHTLLSPHPGITFGERKCISSLCFNNTVTFEKITSQTLRTSELEPLPVNRIGQGVTLDCLEQCERLNVQCSALIVDYVNNKCFRISHAVQQQENITPFKTHSYFEKVCLQGIGNRCHDKAWTFSRYLKHELSGLDNKIVTGVQSRVECEEHCLREISFECRSADYVYSSAECRLSAFDKRGKPQAFHATQENIDYLENECSSNFFENEVVKKEYMSPTFVEHIQTQLKTVDECKDACAAFQKFNCRTAGFRPQTGECLLSSDDLNSAAENFAQNHPETILIERKAQITTAHKVSYFPAALPAVPGYPYPDISHLWNAFSKSILSAATTTSSTTSLTMETTKEGPVQSSTRAPSLVYIGGRCRLPAIGFTEYEKIIGYRLNAGLTAIQLSSMKSEQEVVKKCKDFCDLNRSCYSFNINYNTGQCSSLIEDSTTAITNFQNSEGVGYFEPICFQSRGCGRLWTFERHLNKTLLGHAIATYKGISKAACQEKCLVENEFSCNSATYNYDELECRLSSEDRFSKPFAFASTPNTDYLENQCSRTLTLRQRYPCIFIPIIRNQILSYADRVIHTENEIECQKACETELHFVCRSYSFIALHLQNQLQAPDCRLSADTQTSEGAQLQQYLGAIYVERNCLPITDISSSTTFENTERTTTPENSFVEPKSTSKTTVMVADLPSTEAIQTTRSTTPSTQRTEATTTTYYQEKETTLTEVHTQSTGTSTIATTSMVTMKPSQPPYRSRDGNLPASNNSDCSYEAGFIYERTMGFHVHKTTPTMEIVLVSSTSKNAIFDCLQMCTLKNMQCLAFTAQYPVSSSYTTCTAINQSSAKDRSKLVPISGAAHFEKICLKNVKGCKRLWTFDRVMGFYLNDTFGTELHLKTKDDCIETCLANTAMPCRSASYIYSNQLCKMSSETRRTRPESFYYIGNDVDYLENQCISETTTGEYALQHNKINPFINRVIFGVFTLEECQLACNQEKQFICRSVSYEVLKKFCYLSAEDEFSSPGGKNILYQFGIVYSEKSGYSQVKVVCSRTEMLVTIKFDNPFDGILYAKGNPVQCFFPGNSKTQVTISIPLGSRCGTVEESPGRYRNDVVIQQHPIIMTTSDKVFRIVCTSSVTDKTVKIPIHGKTAVNVAYGSFQLAEPPTLLSSAAITPTVKMKITDPRGREVSSVNLGEPLFFRIEPPPNSRFGIFAKNLVARSEFLEFILLIDAKGCATDPYVFPTLYTEQPSKALVSPFTAFRFPSTGIIYFEVEIQFCQYYCPLPNCHQNNTRSRHKQRDLLNKLPKDNTTTENYFLLDMNENFQNSSKDLVEVDKFTQFQSSSDTYFTNTTSPLHEAGLAELITAPPLPLRKSLNVT